MLSKSENELLTRVGPGTPMGDLMRRYWHPIAAAGELDTAWRTREVRILGEDLVLYRDRSGRLGLIDSRCSHRRVNLAYGVVEDDGIRCQYHGWKFNETGACVEQPFEETVRPDGRFKEKCGVVGYPVVEKGGLVFAYLGPQPAPLLPNWEALVWDNVVRDIAISELPCNWLQCQENSLDPVHVEWLHSYFGNYARQIKGLAGGPGGSDPVSGVQMQRYSRHMRIGFDLFDYGIIKRRMVAGTTEEDEDWAVGHPIIFPNILLVGNQFSATLQFRVPVDDEHTYHVSLYTFRAAPGQEAPKQQSVPYRMVDLKEPDGRFNVDYTFNQDYMAWITQGPVARRDKEKLGESDKGIILFRRLLKQEMQKVQQGLDPMNTFRDPATNESIVLPLEGIKLGQTKRPAKYVPGEQGYSADAPKIEATQRTWDALPETRLDPART